MKQNKRIYIMICVLAAVILLVSATSYALFTYDITKNTDFKIAVGDLELVINDAKDQNKFTIENMLPTEDEIALEQDGYLFTVTNNGKVDSYYTIYLDDITVDNGLEKIKESYVKYNLLDHSTNYSYTSKLSDLSNNDRILTTGILKAGASINYTLKMWVDYEAGNDAQNTYFATQIRVVGTQANAVAYQERILNGADPVLTDNLVPIQIADDGTVTKADISEEWYDYETKRWANAVVLKEKKIYANNEIIPESNIESYFVWIPKYSYQLWDLGNYDSLTSIDSTKSHAIPIRFGLSNTSDDNEGECTTPGTAGASGNCSVGDYMTHPAFLAFDTNGIWVGKFETGYEGATSTATAQVNSSDSSKVIIKPNVYSWRNITIGNAFKASYDYLRSDESHMMKNTEWGAVAYLHHSTYGLQTNLRTNNNSAYITGYAATVDPTVGYSSSSIDGNRYESTSLGVDSTYTVNYLNTSSQVASTTGNYSGIYDMSGGAWDYAIGYTSGASTVGGNSGITSIYNDFFTNSNWNKYYDKYSSTTLTSYNNRILGDATGEIGPFAKVNDPDNIARYRSSWHNDYAVTVDSNYSWSIRGGNYMFGVTTGIFAFLYNGVDINDMSFRIVLAPTK